MKLLLFLGLFTSVTLLGRTQVIETRIDTFITKEKIDSFLIYSVPCAGYITFDTCKTDESHYLIWKNGSGYYLKRFDFCKIFEAIPIDTLNPLSFYYQHKDTINKEEILQPTYYEIKISKRRIDSLIVTSTVDHTCFHKFRLPSSGDQTYKYASFYDLEFVKFENGIANVNYRYNDKTKLKEMINITLKLIDDLKAKGRLPIQ